MDFHHKLFIKPSVFFVRYMKECSQHSSSQVITFTSDKKIYRGKKRESVSEHTHTHTRRGDLRFVFKNGYVKRNGAH